MNESRPQISINNIDNAIAIKRSAIDRLSTQVPSGKYALWGEVTCKCGEAFNLYRHEDYSSLDKECEYASQLEAHLNREDSDGVPHREIYNLHFLEVPVEVPGQRITRKDA